VTELLEKAVEAVRRMPPDAQDAIAQAMLDMARPDAPGDIDPNHLQDVLDGLDEIARGEIATHEEVEAAFRRFER
jgi:predicted transcriptional regulator